MFQIQEIGAIVRWLFKGCKTKLKDEIHRDFETDMKNLFIGCISVFILLGLILLIFFT